MPQLLLPLVPHEPAQVSPFISVIQEYGRWTWMAGLLPIFSHLQDDRNSFRMLTAQLVCPGICKQVDIIKAFGVSVPSVKRVVEQYRERGPASFFERTRKSSKMMRFCSSSSSGKSVQENSRRN